MSFRGSTLGRHASRWLIAIGAFELGLAALFAYLGLTLPSFVASGMWLTAAILGATGIVLVLIGLRVRGSAAATEHLLATGIPGTARIVGLTQTGMYLNQNPQIRMDLMVEIPGRAPYAAQRQEFVPLMLLGRLTSGAPLPVRVDPHDPQRLVVDWQNTAVVPFAVPVAQPGQLPFVGGAVVPGAVPAVPMTAAMPGTSDPPMPVGTDAAPARAEPVQQPASPAAAPSTTVAPAVLAGGELRRWLQSNGVSGTARVDLLEDSGQTVGDERMYTIELTLNPTVGPPQKLGRSAVMVPRTAWHRLFQGMNVPVRYAADNPNILVVEWDRV